MTEKRFTLKYPHWTHVLCDTVEDKEYYLRLLEKREDVVNLLNQLSDENEQLKQQLQKIQDSFEFNCTQNYVDFNKDKLYIKDNNTEIRLDGTNLFIEVYIPQIDEYNRFKYMVTGRRLMERIY